MQATIAQTWFTGWTTSTFPPEDVSWEKYSVVTFAFVVTTSQVSDLAVAQEDDPTLRKLVQLGHANVSVCHIPRVLIINLFHRKSLSLSLSVAGVVPGTLAAR